MLEFIGSEKQVEWAKDIYARLSGLYGEEKLPQVKYASFWIQHRNSSFSELLTAPQVDSTFKTRSQLSELQRQRVIQNLRTLATKQIVLLDTETTGFSSTAEILEITAASITGEVLLHSRVKPQRAQVDKGAYKTHGIALEDVRECPTFKDIWEKLYPILHNKVCVTYNAEYDIRLICQSLSACGVRPPYINSSCLMEFCKKYFDVSSLKLMSACIKCGVDQKEFGKAHGSKADTLAASAVLRTLYTLENIPFLGECPLCGENVPLVQKGVNIACKVCFDIETSPYDMI